MKEHAETTMPALSRRAFVGTAAVTAGAAAATKFCRREAQGQRPDNRKSAADPYEGAQVNFSIQPVRAGVPAPQPEGICLRRQNRQSRIFRTHDCAACARGIARGFGEKDPDRLTKPFAAQLATRGSGEFKEIEWSEVFDLIQEKFQDATDTDGVHSILLCNRIG